MRSDAELLKATGADGRAFAAFYDRYEALIVGYFARRIADPEVVADLTAEVFASALGAAHRYRASRPTAANWLFTIAHNTLAKSVRRRRVEARARRRLGIREAVAFATAELDHVTALGSDAAWSAELLARLPTDQAEAIRARVLHDRAYPEIAAELGTSELVIRKRVSRGLAALRTELEEERGR